MKFETFLFMIKRLERMAALVVKITFIAGRRSWSEDQ